jgi:hypothetical protein
MDAFTKESIDALPDIPSWWGLRYTEPKDVKVTRKSTVPMDSMLKLINYFAWKVFGDMTWLMHA